MGNFKFHRLNQLNNDDETTTRENKIIFSYLILKTMSMINN